MSLAERYVRATLSGNLRNDSLHFSPEILMAMALSSHFGGLLARVKYANDAASYHRLLSKWTDIVTAKAGRRAWPEHIDVGKVAYLSLRRWLNSVCPACTGLQRVKVLGAPVLSDRNCPLCQGTGQTELRCSSILRDYVLDMIEELDSNFWTAVARTRKKLRSDSEDANAKLKKLA